MVGEYSVGLTPEAQKDIDLLLCQYDVRDPRAGKRLIERLTRAFEQLASYPESAPIEQGEVRRLLLNPLPFALYYAIQHSQKEVLIGAMIHVHQHPDTWKERFL